MIGIPRKKPLKRTLYRVPVEYATVALQNILRDLFVVGGVLGAWHVVAAVAILVAGARARLNAGISPARVALEIVALVVVNVIALGLLAWLLALPSSITPKIDFRASADVHTDTLVWSNLNPFPVAPLLSFIAVVIQFALLRMWLRRKGD